MITHSPTCFKSVMEAYTCRRLCKLSCWIDDINRRTEMCTRPRCYYSYQRMDLLHMYTIQSSSLTVYTSTRTYTLFITYWPVYWQYIAGYWIWRTVCSTNLAALSLMPVEMTFAIEHCTTSKVNFTCLEKYSTYNLQSNWAQPYMDKRVRGYSRTVPLAAW